LGEKKPAHLFLLPIRVLVRTPGAWALAFKDVSTFLSPAYTTMPRIQGRLFAAGIRFLVHASAFLSENVLGHAVVMNDANMAVTIGLYLKHASPAMIHLVSSQNSQFPL